MQSNQPFGEAIISNSACVSLPNDLCLFDAGIEFVTFFTNSMSFVEFEVEEETAISSGDFFANWTKPCCFTVVWHAFEIDACQMKELAILAT